MQYRRFGRSDLQISVLTFGGGWVGGLLIDSAQEVSNQALQQAYDAGINWVDTASSYGSGLSETVIGRWLATRTPAQRPYVSTKFRVEPNEPDLAGQMRKSVEASLERLQLSKVNVLYLHNQILADDSQTPEGPRGIHVSRVIERGGIADAMEKLREAGLVDHLGLTGLGEAPAVARIVDSSRFDAVQVYYNMSNPSAGWDSAPPGWNTSDFSGLLAKCRQQDTGVMAIRIFAAGHLATRVRHGRELPVTENAGNEAEEARAEAVWAALGESHGTPAQTALRFGLGCPDLSTIEVGMAKIEHLEQAVAAEARGSLPESCIEALRPLWNGHPAFVS
ncbi:MAG TPA: aldo/keto reductase [Alphaproteobacteria bacterium]|nr:aldo/keto reductase [Alphaproteobacteria bacterium]